jgi:hypothetical protein
VLVIRCAFLSKSLSNGPFGWLEVRDRRDRSRLRRYSESWHLQEQKNGGESVRVFISADMEGVTGVTHPQDSKGIPEVHVYAANYTIHNQQSSTISGL